MFFENGCVPEWPNGADCKSAVFDFGGSNPSAPTYAFVKGRERAKVAQSIEH